MIAFFKNFSLIFFQDVDLEICIFAGLVKKANSYEAVIGLEVHSQLSTESKLFSSDPNQYGAEPNQQTSVISLRHPGALAGQLDLIQESNAEAIMKHVLDALDKYPEKIREYLNGKKGLVWLFMGEVMKSTRGKADPSVANKMIIQELEKRK